MAPVLAPGIGPPAIRADPSGVEVRVADASLRGLPKELAPHFDLDGDGAVTETDLGDVVDYFDGLPPGNGNHVIDGREVDHVRRFVESRADPRIINAVTARRLADRLRSQINCWATQTLADFDRTARVRDRVEQRYQGFSNNDALFSDTLLVASNLVLGIGLTRIWTVASVIVPYAIIEGARWIRGRDLLVHKELRAKLDEAQEHQNSDNKDAVGEIQRELLDLVNAVSTSPSALRKLASQLESRLVRPSVPTEDAIYRDVLILHARKNGCSVRGSEDNRRRSGKFYDSSNVFNPLRISGPVIAMELNRLDPKTQVAVDTSPAKANTKPPRRSIPATSAPAVASASAVASTPTPAAAAAPAPAPATAPAPAPALTPAAHPGALGSAASVAPLG